MDCKNESAISGAFLQIRVSFQHIYFVYSYFLTSKYPRVQRHVPGGFPDASRSCAICQWLNSNGHNPSEEIVTTVDQLHSMELRRVNPTIILHSIQQMSLPPSVSTHHTPYHSNEVHRHQSICCLPSPSHRILLLVMLRYPSCRTM